MSGGELETWTGVLDVGELVVSHVLNKLDMELFVSSLSRSSADVDAFISNSCVSIPMSLSASIKCSSFSIPLSSSKPFGENDKYKTKNFIYLYYVFLGLAYLFIHQYCLYLKIDHH